MVTLEIRVNLREPKLEVDPQSGAKVIFVTTRSASDSNFFFHERCFLWNNRMLLFNSVRFDRSEVMAYLLDTGELRRLTRLPGSEPGQPEWQVGRGR